MCNFQNSTLQEFGNKFSPFAMKVKLLHLLLVLLSPFFSLDDFFVSFSRQVNRKTFITQDALDDNLFWTRTFLGKCVRIDQASHS